MSAQRGKRGRPAAAASRPRREAAAQPAPGWPAAWFAAAQPRSTWAWRGVESQHVVATMRLTDTLAEQVLLEQILERSKPPLPPGAQGRHPLLVTPFRYRPRHGSRFRRAGALGVWYGAEALRTACAEVAYWRWRFIIDSAGLAGEELLTQHLFFRARVEGTCLDLSAAPWNRQRAWWRHSSDYSHTQSLAEAARERGVGWIRYASARDPAGVCAAALEPEAVVELDAASEQSWSCRTTTRSVRLIHGSERHEWLFSAPP